MLYSMRTGLLIYDVVNKKKYQKIYRILNAYHVRRIQNSVFEIEDTDSRIDEMFNKLCGILDGTKDKISLIPLCKNDISQVLDIGIVQKRMDLHKTYQVL